MADRVSLPASEPICVLPRSCCRCSNRGRCLDCSCAKSGLPCASLPSRKGQCANYSPPASAIDATPVLLPSTSSGVADGSGARMPGTSGAGESAIVEDAVGSEVVRGSCAEGARLYLVEIRVPTVGFVAWSLH